MTRQERKLEDAGYKFTGQYASGGREAKDAMKAKAAEWRRKGFYARVFSKLYPGRNYSSEGHSVYAKAKNAIGVVIRDPGKKIFNDIKKVKAAGGNLFMRKPTGRRHNIEACEIEFYEGGNTIWVHSALGATVLRIQCTGQIEVRKACENPVAHSDIQVQGNIDVCVPKK